MTFLNQQKGPIVLDGAMGTELIERGLVIRSDIAESWVLQHPEIIDAIHRAYVEAGARAIQTCTFGALRSRLAPHGLQDSVNDICLHAVTLARRAGRDCAIVGSLGPTGLVGGAVAGEHAARIQAEVAEAAKALVSVGVDAIHLETQYAPGELTAAAAGVRQAMAEASADVPLWISITVTTGATGLETPHGVPIDRMVRALAEARPDAIGVNCSLDADRMRGAVERLVAANLGPVLARPQARMSEKCATGRSRESASSFAERAARLFELGAVAVGGCCGTSPASIAALAARVGVTRESVDPPATQEVAR